MHAAKCSLYHIKYVVVIRHKKAQRKEPTTGRVFLQTHKGKMNIQFTQVQARGSNQA